jgi:hypothetical protein
MVNYGFFWLEMVSFGRRECRLGYQTKRDLLIFLLWNTGLYNNIEIRKKNFSYPILEKKLHWLFV